MFERWLAIGALVSSLLLLGLSPSPPLPSLVEPTESLRVAPTLRLPSSDTLRADATSETPLLLSLPSELGDAPVARYTMLQGPALSGVAGRSFTWIPNGSNPGTYEVRLHAHHPDTAPDTLVLRIDLQP